MNDIKQWLDDLDLGMYAEEFQTNAVDMELLPDLDEADLEKLGVAALGHRKKLLRAIIALSAPLVPDEARPRDVSVPPLADAERRQLTLMFCDLVGSTALSQRLDPEDLREVMRRYQDAVAGAVTRYQGHVAKFLGDGVLAYFGWPQAYEDQAERAIRAGLAVVTAVQAVRLDGQDRTLRARVGIATGQVVVGDLVGETASDAQAVTGETPNLAARLQGVAEAGQVVIGSATRRLIGATFDLIELGGLDLKGFSEAVSAWGVIGEGAMQSRFDASRTGALTRLVGREHELGLLLARWDMAKNGEGQVMLLSGEAGIGKSRMMQALHDEISEQHYFHLRYQCTPHNTNSAFYPIIRRLERAAGFFAEDDNDTKLDKLETLLKPTAGDLEAITPLFAALLSLPGDDRYGSHELSPQQLRDRTVAALIDQVLALSRLRPVLFALEDAHWIDPSTESLVGEIMSQTTDAAVFMLITHRPDYEPPWTGHTHQASMTLSRLSRNQGAEIVRDIGGREMSDGMIERIIARADGVPLYVEELAKSVAETGATAIDQNREFQIPETLQASLIARLDRLGEAKYIAQVGAVIGREFPYALIAAATETAGGELVSSLDRLIASELIHCRGTPPEAIYTFKHALIQDTAYESLLHSRRREIHARIARSMERLFPAEIVTQPELLAHHYTAAQLHEPAVANWQRAGERALGRLAMREAGAHLRKAIEVLQALSVDQSRDRREFDLQRGLGVALRAASGPANPATVKAFTRAYELGKNVGQGQELFRVVYGVFYFHWASRDGAESRRFADELYELARTSRDREQLLVAHSALGLQLWSDSENTKAQPHFEEALSLYDHQADGSLIGAYAVDFGILTHRYHAATRFALGHPEQALRWTEKALELAQLQDNPISLCFALAGGCVVLKMLRAVETTLEWAEECLLIAAENELPTWSAYGRMSRGWAIAHHGDVEQGIAEFEAGMDGFRTSGTDIWRPMLRCLLTEIHIMGGHADTALALVEQELERVKKQGKSQFDSLLLYTRGDALLAHSGSNQAAAEDCYRQAMELARADNARSWELRAAFRLARLWRDQGQADAAHALLAPIHGGFAEGFATPDLMDAKALLDELS